MKNCYSEQPIAKVLMLVPILPPYTGGGANVFYYLGTSLSNGGYVRKLIIVSEYNKKEPFCKTSHRLTVLRVLPPRDGVIRTTLISKALSYVVTQFLLLSIIPIIALRYRINIFHFTRYMPRNFSSIDFIVKVFRVFGVKIVADRRGPPADVREVTRRSADFWLWNSQSAKQGCKSLKNFPYCGRVIESPWLPPDLGLFEHYQPKKLKHEEIPQRFFLFLGSISSRKRALECLRAYVGLEEEIKRFHPLVFAGKNVIGPSFDRLVRQYRGVTYLGELPYDDALYLVWESVGVILPSRREGIPRVALEALFLGKRVVCPEGVPELNGVAGVIQPARHDILGIRDGLRDILRADYHDGCPYPFEKHQPGECARRTGEVYDSLLR